MLRWWPRIQISGTGLALVTAYASPPDYIKTFLVVVGITMMLWPVLVWGRGSFLNAKRSRRVIIVRLLVLSVPVLLIAGLALYPTLVHQPAFPDISIALGGSNYPAGQDLYGLKWKEGRDSFELNVLNSTDSNLEDVSIIVQANMMIYEVGASGSVNLCSAAPANTAAIKLELGTRTFPDGHQESFKSNIFTYYRIHCDKILSHSSVHVIVSVPKKMPMVLEAMPRMAGLEWGAVSVEYSQNGASRKPLFERQCFIASCGNSMPLTPPKIAN